MLADLVRTDGHNHRPVAGDSPESEGIKIVARVHQNLIWARVRHTNGVRNTLREYYPVALETFGDLAHRDALAVLGSGTHPHPRCPPDPAPDPSPAQRRRTATQPRYGRLPQIQAGLRGVHLSAPGPVEDAYGTTVASLVAIIVETNHQITELEATLQTPERWGISMINSG